MTERPRRRGSPWTDRDGLQAVLDCLPVNLFVCDRELRLVYLSPTAAQTLEALRDVVRAEFGVDVSDLHGMSIHRFHKDPAGVERILDRPEMFPHQATFALGDLQLLTTITAIQDSRERIIGFIAVVDNITEKHQLSQHLAHAATELGGSSEQLARLAEGLDETAAGVTRRAQAMSTATEDLTASINTVFASASVVTSSTRSVVDSAAAATGSVAKLGQSSERIGEVTGLITSIAEQTRLLALNATIEATRAGDAGRGFAVVANEVKELAQRTRSATDQIVEMISALQADTAAAATAIQTIVGGIEQVRDQQAEISVAVEQQAVSARELAAGVEEVAASVGGVASTTHSAREAAAALLSQAGELDRLVRAAED